MSFMMYNWDQLDDIIPPSMLAPIDSTQVIDAAQQQGFNSQAVGETFPLQLFPAQQGFNGHSVGELAAQQTMPGQQNVWSFDNPFQSAVPDGMNFGAGWDNICVMHTHPEPVAFKDCPCNMMEPDNLFEGLAATENALESVEIQNPVAAPTEQWLPLIEFDPPATFQPPEVKQETLPASPGPGFSNKPSRPSHRSIVSVPKGIVKSRAKQSPINKSTSMKCEACEKIFSLNSAGNDGVHCPRCAKIIRKNRVGPPVFKFDSAISSFDEAWQSVYPYRPPLSYEGDGVDDWESFVDRENEWVKQFIECANVPYTEADGPDSEAATRSKGDHNYYLKQQETYNKKPFNESSKDVFTNDEVNVRMRFLFQAVIRYHAGGHVVYPASGDNRGYGDDRTLKCSERLDLIGCFLATDKRILMNVIEGRGVLGFVAHPKRYAGRKTMNKSCNETKRQMIERGETLAPQEAVKVRMERRLRNRKRQGTEEEGED